MAEIRNLTRNGETFYPLTHEKAVIGMEDFKETITTQISQYQPIEITGDVTNAPDEEDITSDSNNLLKFKNRNNLYGLGKAILRRGSSFASQVTQANTIYVIQYNFDLGSARINIPNGSILLFEGGTLSNGTLVCADLYDVRLVYYQDVTEILSSVTLEGNFIHKACDKDTIRQILVDNSSITKDVNDVLSVKVNGIQNTHLNSNTVDNSSISLDTNNKISIKDGGVTGNKLNSAVVNTDDLSIVNSKIQLANRGTSDGMGKIILRKDQSFASQLTQTNTIYVIRYDFTLTGDVTIPANCVLKFDGGSISGAYALIGNNTYLSYEKNIFGNVEIRGTWIAPIISTDMFKSGGDILFQIGNLLLADIHNDIYIGNCTAYLNNTNNYNSSNGYYYGIQVKSNTSIYITGTIAATECPASTYNVIGILGNDISIFGGVIIGDKALHTASGGEWGHGIGISTTSKNIIITGCEIYNCWGDCICGYGEKIIIRNCKLHDSRRLGIGATFRNCIIENNEIYNISGTAPQFGIDVEIEMVADISDCYVNLNKVYNCASGSIEVVGRNSGLVTVSNNNCDGKLASINTNDVIFENNTGGTLRISSSDKILVKDSAFGNILANNSDNVSINNCKFIITSWISKITNGSYIFNNSQFFGGVENSDNIFQINLENNNNTSSIVLKNSIIKDIRLQGTALSNKVSIEIINSKLYPYCVLFDHSNMVTDSPFKLIIKNNYIKPTNMDSYSINGNRQSVIIENNYIYLSDNLVARITSNIYAYVENKIYTNHVDSGATNVVVNRNNICNNDETFLMSPKIEGTYADRPSLNISYCGFEYFAIDKGVAGVGAMIYYTGDSTTPWVYADGTPVS